MIRLLGGSGVTRGVEQQLCCHPFLEVKLTMEFRKKGSNSKELAHWMHTEKQNDNKQAQYTISWLLLSVTAKMKVKEEVGADPDTGPNLDSGL